MNQGGTGTTFVSRAIQSLSKVRNYRVIAVATSAVASSLLEKDGRSAHSIFKIPITCYAESVCNISMESNTANELRHSLIIWDEAVTCVRYCIAAVDRTQRVIMKSPNIPFGVKCFLFNRDVGQILPVVPIGSRSMIAFMCFKSSPLYQSKKYLN